MFQIKVAVNSGVKELGKNKYYFFEAIFIISSQETAEREWLDAAVRDEGIATAISEERNAADGHSQPGRLPDEIMKVAKKFIRKRE